MKWEYANLVSQKKESVDRLGNTVMKDTVVAKVCCRFAPWNDVDLRLDGRGITNKTSKLLVRCKYKDFPDCCKIKINGCIYSITEKTATGRFTILYIKKDR